MKVGGRSDDGRSCVGDSGDRIETVETMESEVGAVNRIPRKDADKTRDSCEIDDSLAGERLPKLQRKLADDVGEADPEDDGKCQVPGDQRKNLPDVVPVENAGLFDWPILVASS